MGESILVIDDELDLRENIKEILMNYNYKVHTAPTANQALEMLKTSVPDLIISDIMMPDLNGLEFLELLKNDSTLSSIPFIFLTAKSTYDDLRKGMANGADDYLYKPFKAQDLLNAVKSKLNKVSQLDYKLNDLKEKIALSVPHEFRTPLTPIMGLSDLMKENLKDFSKDEIEKMSYSINTNAKRLHNRIEKFILLANIHTELNSLRSKRSNREFVTNDIKNILNQAIIEVSQVFNSEAKVILNVAEASLKIDEYYFTISIRELVENAFKFTEPMKKIIIKGESIGTHYLLSFTNDGKGLTAEQIRNIDLFNKHYEQTKEGSGIGLTIVNKIMEYFGGELIIESAPNVQTKISIKIPLKKNYYSIDRSSYAH